VAAGNNESSNNSLYVKNAIKIHASQQNTSLIHSFIGTSQHTNLITNRSNSQNVTEVRDYTYQNLKMKGNKYKKKSTNRIK